jgi:predicted nucleotidyltransferase
MNELLPEQIEALAELQQTAKDRAVEVVLIGAAACRAWVKDEYRMTEDIDLVVGVDLSELPRLTQPLLECGWRKDRRWEQRWISGGGARVDLIPVGGQARREKRLTWPLGETTMSLVGVEHVFRDAVERAMAPGLVVRVVPLVVLALLKIVSYLEEPHVRRKDLSDLAGILDVYEEGGDRRFSHVVLDEGVDYSEAGAYLLGCDLARLCADDDERAVVQRFVDRFSAGSDASFAADRPFGDAEAGRGQRFRLEMAAFGRGWSSTNAGSGLRT